MKTRPSQPAAPLALVTLLLAWSHGDTFSGKVVGLADGDTITVLVGQEQVKVRLEGIDAPERGQPFADAARKRLSLLIYGQQVRVEVRDNDRYGRVVGRVFVLDRDVSVAMVRSGMAWHFTKYNDEAELASAQRSARSQYLGIWSQPNAVAPWDWRDGRRTASSDSSWDRIVGSSRAGTMSESVPKRSAKRIVAESKPSTPYQPAEPAVSGDGCGPKRFCSQMSSCAEARRYLACGLTRLDGDGDGVPCEDLCG